MKEQLKEKKLLCLDSKEFFLVVELLKSSRKRRLPQRKTPRRRRRWTRKRQTGTRAEKMIVQTKPRKVLKFKKNIENLSRKTNQSTTDLLNVYSFTGNFSGL